MPLIIRKADKFVNITNQKLDQTKRTTSAANEVKKQLVRLPPISLER
jgi:hypothetical protein